MVLVPELTDNNKKIIRTIKKEKCSDRTRGIFFLWN